MGEEIRAILWGVIFIKLFSHAFFLAPWRAFFRSSFVTFLHKSDFFVGTKRANCFLFKVVLKWRNLLIFIIRWKRELNWYENLGYYIENNRKWRLERERGWMMKRNENFVFESNLWFSNEEILTWILLNFNDVDDRLWDLKDLIKICLSLGIWRQTLWDTCFVALIFDGHFWKYFHEIWCSIYCINSLLLI